MSYLFVAQKISFYDGNSREDLSMFCTPVGVEVFNAQALFAIDKNSKADAVGAEWWHCRLVGRAE